VDLIIRHLLTTLTRFKDVFNNKPMLLPFNNGVVKLLTKTFRQHAFDDYLTTSTGYDYTTVDYTGNSEHAAIRTEINAVMQGIQPDEEMREYEWEVCAAKLDAIRYTEIILRNGRGGNGKSVVVQKMAEVLDAFYLAAVEVIIKDMKPPPQR
jgi:phage/plasmid-associated DNA primase